MDLPDPGKSHEPRFTMSATTVKGVRRAHLSEGELRLRALANAAARKARISAQVRDPVPEPKQRCSLWGPLSTQVRPCAYSPNPIPGLAIPDVDVLVPMSILCRAPTPAPTAFACLYVPSSDPEQLAEANPDVLATIRRTPESSIAGIHGHGTNPGSHKKNQRLSTGGTKRTLGMRCNGRARWSPVPFSSPCGRFRNLGPRKAGWYRKVLKNLRHRLAFFKQPASMKGLRIDDLGQLSCVVFGGFPSMKGVRVDDLDHLSLVGNRSFAGQLIPRCVWG